MTRPRHYSHRNRGRFADLDDRPFLDDEHAAQNDVCERACAMHLADLYREHKAAPPDVVVKPMRRVIYAPRRSYSLETSFGALCADA
jgi:hypothetical protein